MKLRFLFFVLFVFSMLSVSAQGESPKLDDYGTLGIYPVGFLSGGYSGVSYGGVSFSSISDFFLFEMSGFKFVKWKKEINTSTGHYTDKDFVLNEGLTVDIGLNFIIMKRVSLAFVPYAWTWTADCSDGFAILSKVRFNHFVIEGKAVSKAYFKGYNKKWYNNNSYLGINYYLTDNFALGFRHNRQGEYFTNNASVTVSF